MSRIDTKAVRRARMAIVLSGLVVVLPTANGSDSLRAEDASANANAPSDRLATVGDMERLHIPPGYEKYIDRGLLRIRGNCYYVANPRANGRSHTASGDLNWNLSHTLTDADSSCADPFILGFPDSFQVANTTAPYFRNWVVADSCQVTSLFHRDQLYGRTSFDCGESWTDSVLIAGAGNAVGTISVAETDSILYLVWEQRFPPENGIYISRSFDLGQTWETKREVAPVEYHHPGVAASDSIVVVVMALIEGIDIRTVSRRSTDYGLTWSDDIPIGDEDGPTGIDADCQARGNVIYATYGIGHGVTGFTEIAFTSSPDGGVTWVPPIVLSYVDTDHSQWPHLDANQDGRVIVTWFDHKNSSFIADIHSIMSVDSGLSWGSINVVESNDSASHPDVVVTEDEAVIVWEDTRVSPSNREVYGRVFHFGIEDWSGSFRVSYTSRHSTLPRITAESNSVYIGTIQSLEEDGQPLVQIGKSIRLGDLTADDLVTVADVISLMDHLYRLGPDFGEPRFLDINGDTELDILDVIFLIDHVLRGGPQPCPQ